MLDFTVKKYIQLLNTLIAQGYHFQTFSEYLAKSSLKSIVLRHDVDKRPQNSLTTARIEHKLGLKGTYNFRAVPQSWNEGIIKEISSLGHEIGYHYEELSTHKGDHESAIDDFKMNLEKLRKPAESGMVQRSVSETKSTQHKKHYPTLLCLPSILSDGTAEEPCGLMN